MLSLYGYGKNISSFFSNFGLVCRYTARSSCKVDLRDYPLDEQICHLAFESCTYNLSKIQSNLYITALYIAVTL